MLNSNNRFVRTLQQYVDEPRHYASVSFER